MASGEAEGVRGAFRRLYHADRARGERHDLAHYKGLFPGFWDVVAEEFGALEAAAPEPTIEATPPPSSSTPGTGPGRPASKEEVVGPYRLLKELGRGGMGVVYLAENTRVRRRVALKVLSPQFSSSQHLLLRFRREAEVASRIDHPGICAVYDADVDGEVPYIAMRLVEGQTLQQWIATSRAPSGEAGTEPHRVTRLPGSGSDPGPAAPARPGDTGLTTSALRKRDEVFRVVHLMEKAARALHVAHEAGLIHRDIKPGNIMVSQEGEPVVLDFGLARADDEESHQLTQTGSLMGTPAYMSPEQLTAQRIKLDRRTDIYSLGATLYECLTLRLPFEAPTVADLYQKILATEPENPRRINPAIPDDLRVVVQTAMDKDRNRRYQTALDFAEDLRRVREFEPIKARPVSQWVRLGRWAQRNRALAASVFGLFAALAAGLGASLFLLQSATSARVRAEKSEGEARTNLDKALAAERKATEEAERARTALAKEAEERGQKEKALGELAETLKSVEAERDAKTRALAEAEGRRLPVQSAAVLDEDPTLALLLALEGERRYSTVQGRTAVLAALGRLRERRVVGIPRVLVGDGLRPFGLVLPSPDGRSVAGFHADGTVFVVDLRTGEVRQVPFMPCFGIAFDSPGARALSWGSNGAAVVDARSGAVLARIACANPQPAGFLPDGKSVVTVHSWVDDTAINLRFWDADDGRSLRSLTLEGEKPPVPCRLDPIRGLLYAGFSGSRNGIGAYDLASGKLAWRADPKESLPLSAAGNGIVASQERDLAGLRLRDPSTGAVTADLGGPIRTFAFSGDGLLVAGIRQSKPDRVVLWDTAGGSERGGVDTREASISRVCLDGTGRTLAVIAQGWISLWETVGGTLLGRFRAPGGSVNGAEFTADGRSLFVAGSDGTLRLYDTAAAVGPPALAVVQGTLGANVEFAFDAAGRRLLSLAQGKVVVWDVAEGAARFRPEVQGTTIKAASLHRDGTRLVTVHDDGRARLWDCERGVAEGPPLDAGGTVRNASFAKDAGTVTLVVEGRGAVFLDTSTGRASPWETASGPIRGKILSAEVDPAGVRFLTALDDGTVRIWDLERRTEITSLGVLPGTLQGARFAPDGRSVFRVGPPHYLWNPETGDLEVLQGLPSPGGEGTTASAGSAGVPGVAAPGTLGLDPRSVAYCAVSSDGGMAVTVATDGTARLWDVRSGAERAVLERAGTSATSALFSPDGRLALVLYSDGVAVPWPTNPVAAAAPRAPRRLSPDEMDRYSIGTDQEREAYRREWRREHFDFLNDSDPFVTGAAERAAKALAEHLLPSSAAVALEADTSLEADERDAAVRLARSIPETPAAIVERCMALCAKPGAPRENYDRALKALQAVAVQAGPEAEADRRSALHLAALRTGKAAEVLAEALVASDAGRRAGKRRLLDEVLPVLLLSDMGRADEARARMGDTLAMDRGEQSGHSGPHNETLVFEALQAAFGPKAKEAVDLLGRDLGGEDMLSEEIVAAIREEQGVAEDVRSAAIEMAKARGNPPRVLGRRADAVLRTAGRSKEEYDRALRWADEAATRAPEKVSTAIRGIALYRAGRMIEAVEALRSAPKGHVFARSCLSLALQASGDAEGARKVFDEAHAEAPLCGCEAEAVLLDATERRLRAIVADLHGKHGLYTSVADALQASSELPPGERDRAVSIARGLKDDPMKLNAMAWRVVDHAGEDPEASRRALAWAQAASVALPGNSTVLNTFGVAQFRCGMHDEALATLRRSGEDHAKARSANEAYDLVYQSLCLAGLGRTEEAREALQKARQRGENNSKADFMNALKEADAAIAALGNGSAGLERGKR